MGAKLMVFVILVALLGYYLYEPIPEGFSISTLLKIRGLLAACRLFDLAAVYGSLAGLCTPISIQRVIFKNVSPAPCHDKDSSVQIEEDVFDDVQVRIYRPAAQQGLRPGLVYYHGGGWSVGDLDTTHDLLVLMCKRTNAVIVNVNYRLAPEFIFPIPLNDCVTATKYFAHHVQKFNVDPHRIAIGGDSAGGNLAAAVALKLRDEKFEPKIKMQILIYPVLQAIDYQLPSMLQNGDGPLLKPHLMAQMQCVYLNGKIDLIPDMLTGEHVSPAMRKKMASTFLNVRNLPSKYLVGYERLTSLDGGDDKIWKEIGKTLLNPYFSPLVASDVTNLPMSYVFTCDYDVLRDEGILYTQRMKDAGNTVTHVNADVCIHGIFTLGLDWPETSIWIDGLSKYIEENL